MAYRTELIVVAVVTMLVVGGSGLAAAHSWQTEVEQGDMVLGVNTGPEDPIAGMETELSASITDNAAEEGQANRTSWGGVTNQAVEIHINGPDGIHDHVKTHIPEDDSHFHASYVFPEAGNYTITMVTTIDGEEYAFEFNREVSLLPARAEGETVDDINDNVTELNQQVEEMSEQVDELQEQNEKLRDEHESAADAQADMSSSQADSGLDLSTFAWSVGVGLVAIAGGFVAGRRS